MRSIMNEKGHPCYGFRLIGLSTDPEKRLD